MSKENNLEDLIIDDKSYGLGQEHKEKELIQRLRNLIDSDKPFKDDVKFLKNFRLVKEEKMQELARIWCLMNDRQIDNGEAAIMIRDLFKDLVLDYWSNQY